ncbi:flagellar basal body P-ring formation chaperone FlgA [Pseudomonas sp. 8Z]|uniref:flagellar basal body P-ring formation chaperone FlgA n=1 Tax=Pseudomonas sp. 8Z TaxID=2653166 RepID=UPI002113E31D|nr:flagellar basal body P-ring formation chaperone FlgA [Pseudomonas sp. 8Z]
MSVVRFPHRRGLPSKCGSAFSACALLLLLAATHAQAAPAAAEQIDQAIATYMQQQLQAQAKREAWKGMRHSLGTTLLNNAEHLAPCSQALKVERRSDDPSPLERQRLELSCADGAGWQVLALVQASVQLPVAHAATVIERGQTISAEQVQLQDINIARNVRGFYNDPQDVIGQGAKRRIRSGQLIAPNLLSEPLLVRRGQQVTIIASQDGISASVSGEALANGRAAEVIRVRNLGSQKVIEAQVVEEGVVTSTFR